MARDEVGGERVQRRLRSGQTDAGLQPPDRGPARNGRRVAARIGGGKEDVDVPRHRDARTERDLEPFRHHRDDRGEEVVDFDVPADQRRIAAPAPLPQLVADRDAGDVLLPHVVTERQRPAEEGPDAEHAEQVVRGRCGGQDFHVLHAGEVGVDTDEGGERLEDVGAIAKTDELLRREHCLPQPASAVRTQRDQAVRIRVGEWTQENGTDDREHRRRRADAEGDDGHGRNREESIAAEDTTAVAEVAQQVHARSTRA